MRVLGGLSVLILVLLVAGTAPAASSDECGPEFVRLDEAPEWSQDGSQIAFARRRVFDCTSGADTSFFISVVDADGGNQHSLLTIPDTVFGLAWSPEGRRLAFLEYSRDGPFLRVIDTQDGHELLHADLRLCCSGGPTWSPDGSHIALGTTIVDLATGHVRNPEIPTTGPAAWSPDSRRIAYLGPTGLEVAAADGSSRRWIGPGGISAGTVYWSPDGAWIAYQITREFRFVRPDGSGFLEMADEGLLLGWRPDSQAVLDYVPDDQRLLAIDKDDGTADRVGSSPERPLSFSWARTASVYVATDLCPRPGIFVKPADGAPVRLTNDCVIRGTSGADRLLGTPLPDAILGGAGNDKIFGLGGDDVLYGGGGKDQISGGMGDDVAFGGAGDDTVAAETVTGGSGRDTLIAGSDPRWQAKAVRARDGQRDVVRCPLGQWPGPSISADRIDRVASRCYGT